MSKRTAEMQGQKFLESDRNYVCLSLMGEEAGYSECWRQPVHQVLWKSLKTLQICIVGHDLDQESVWMSFRRHLVVSG